jgi:hypothetical protein
VTTATPGTAGFLTDRGQRELPTWEVHARGVPEPIWVLDPATSQQAWRPPGLEEDELTGHTARAHLGADGRTITLSFTGIPRAYADYPRADVLEAGAAVAVVPVSADIGPPGFAGLTPNNARSAWSSPGPSDPGCCSTGTAGPCLCPAEPGPLLPSKPSRPAEPTPGPCGPQRRSPSRWHAAGAAR